MDLQDLQNRARLLFNQGKYSSALTLLELGIQQTEDQSTLELEILSLQFAVESMLLHNIDADKTISLLKDKLDSPNFSPESSEYYTLQDLLGLAIYQDNASSDIRKPQISEAKQLITSVMEYRQSVRSAKLSRSYLHYGLIQQYFDDNDSAKEYYSKADELAVAQDDFLLQSQAIYHLGQLAMVNDKFDSAKEYFEQSLQLQLDHNILVYVPFSCIAIARCFSRLNHPNRAVHFYKKAIEVSASIGLDTALSLAHFSLAEYYQDVSDHSKSVHHYLESYHHSKKSNNEELSTKIRNRLRIN